MATKKSLAGIFWRARWDSNSKPLEQLFTNNRVWAQSMVAKDPEFFQRLVSQQAPAASWPGRRFPARGRGPR